VRSLLLAGLCLGAASAYAQDPGVTDPAVNPPPQAAPAHPQARPAKKPSAASKRPPKPATTSSAKATAKAKPSTKAALLPAAAVAAAVIPGQVAPLLPPANSRLVPITLAGASVAATGTTAASIPFEGRSADLSDEAKAELDRLAKDIGEKRLGQVALSAFASGIEPDNRQVALARAFVVRGYLFERGVKSRIEVSGIAGDGERVDIMVPNT
jgi:outer membrane protein OmpA-like peptidoglycan-associated protein